MLSKVINGGCDIDYSSFVTVINKPNSIYPTRLDLRTRLAIEKPRTRKEQCFWYRAPATVNRIATAVDFFNAVNLEARIIKYMWLIISKVTPTLGEYDNSEDVPSRSCNYLCIHF